RRPGKDHGMSATTGMRSDCRKDLLYVFSPNAAPFTARKSYDKFAAYTLLRHGGDFRAAARQLAHDGAAACVSQHPPQRRLQEPHPAISVTDGSAGDPTNSGSKDGTMTKPPSWPEPMANEAFHGVAGKIVNLQEPHTEADKVALLSQLLVAFGSAANRSAH